MCNKILQTLLAVALVGIGSCRENPQSTTELEADIDAMRIAENPRAFCWSSDGSRILVTSESGIVSVKALGGESYSLISGIVYPERLHTTIDGRYLFYDVRSDPLNYWSEHSMWRLPLDGTSPAENVYRWGDLANISYSISPNGSFVVYSFGDSTFIHYFDSSELRFGNMGSAVAISDDERHILFARYSLTSGDYSYEALCIPEGSALPVPSPVPETSNLLQWKWLPEGLCVIIADSPIDQLVFCNLDRKIRTPLTRMGRGLMCTLDWSVGGGRIAWWAHYDSGLQMSTMNLETFEVTELISMTTKMAQYTSPEPVKISPLGDAVAFIFGGNLYVKEIND